MSTKKFINTLILVSLAIFIVPGMVSAWDISTVSYDDASYIVGVLEASPRNIAFNTDGTKMFVVGTTNDTVQEFDLSSAFDVSTANLSKSFSVSAQDGFPGDVAFNTDGTKMFVVGAINDKVFEYTLSSAFDISTASFTASSSVTAQETSPTGLTFKPDGTKMFVTGEGNDAVFSYDLSSAFDITTASFTASSSVAAQETRPASVDFNTDGTKMFVAGFDGDDVNEYTLSSAFDITTASFVDSFSIAAQDGGVLGGPAGVAFNTDGTKMYAMGSANDAVFEYTLSTGFDVSTASFVDNFSFLGREPSPHGLTFNTDGTKMFVVGIDNDTVLEYALSSAFDITTASFTASFSVAAQETNPQGITFNTDGTKMFVVGGSGDDVNEYTLSSAFDITTASFVDSFNVSGQEGNPQSVAFNTDGTKMFISGSFDGGVHQYTLSTGFDVSTASYDSVVFYNGQSEFSVNGIFFKPDGLRLYITGSDNDEVNEYSLSTAFDVSDVTFVDNFDVSGQDSSPESVFFKSDGTKMYVLGSSNDSIYQYSVTPPVEVPTVSTAAATNIGNESATLNGSISATGGEAATARGFSYGLTTAYGATTTESGSFSTGSFSASFSASLQCDSTYHFRAFATNSAGTGTGSDATFATGPCFFAGGGGGGGGGGSSSDEEEDAASGTDPLEDSPESRAALQARINEILELLNNLRSALGLPPQSAFPYTRDLTLGSNGNDVTALQNFLIARNTGPAAAALAAVGATGYFGPLTQAALAEYQASAGIVPPAGYFGPITRAHLAGL